MPKRTDFPKFTRHTCCRYLPIHKLIFLNSFRLFWSSFIFISTSKVFGSESSIEGPPGYEYAYGDEFSGSELNQEMWGLGINEKNIQNERVDCVYKLENISVKNGLLIFTQKRESKPVLGKSWSKDILFNYSSGGVHTRKAYDLATTCIWSSVVNFLKTMLVTVPFGQYPGKWETGNRKTFWRSICLNSLLLLKKPDYGADCGGMILGQMNFMMVYPKEVM